MKIVSLATCKDNECVSGSPHQITKRVIVLGLAKPDFPNQVSESLPSQKANVTCPPLVKTTKRKKKPKKKLKKKRKIVPLVSDPEKAIKPNHECVSPTISALKESSVKSDSIPNQITPSVEKGVLHKHSTESAELDGRKTDVNATSVNVKTKGNETEKTASSIEHSSCESSCTDVTLKIKEDKLVSESIDELDKKSKGYEDGQLEVENMMHNKDDMRMSRSGSVSQSAYLENNLRYIHYQSARPVLDPVWRGSFNITQTDYNILEGFVGHLSSKACYKVCEEATTLPSLLCLEMRSKPDLWPKSFLEAPPSDENIALYFFPGDAQNERDFEELVNDMIEEELAMKATAKNAELLIFTSKVLPQSYWRFQGNYYLWGVFRGKRTDDHDLAASNNSNNKISRNKVTSEKEILTTVKTIESHSPQSPLCNYSESVKDMTSKFNKLEKFQGNDFRRWQKKMHFLLTTQKVVYVLSTSMPEIVENETLEQTRMRNKWENDDYICRGYILNGMYDALFGIYQNVESAKELWDSLESKYITEDASSRKFLVSDFNNYKMVDSRPVMEQYNELLRILGQFTLHNMNMDESIAVSSVIDKLPPSWKDFKHTLKHQKEELSLVQLGSHLRIEESLRVQESDKGKGKVDVGQPSVHMVEEKKNNQNIKRKGKKRKYDGHDKSNKKPKDLVCWRCHKAGHMKRDCRVKLNKNDVGTSESGSGGSKDPGPYKGG